MERVFIVDDERGGARDTYECVIEDMGLQPHQVEGPLNDLLAFIASIEDVDVVLYDFHLRKRAYAKWDSDQLVAACFEAKGSQCIVHDHHRSADSTRLPEVHSNGC